MLSIRSCPLDDLYGNDCRNAHCGTFKKGWVYGLYDDRVDDIFYVGSTVRQPGIRYSSHMTAAYPGKFREAWIMAIIADGSLPLFLPLCELTTECEHELKLAEHVIARELQAMGHTAMCDFNTLPVLCHRIPLDVAREQKIMHVRLNLFEYAIAEHLDRVNEQARVVRWLREQFAEPGSDVTHEDFRTVDSISDLNRSLHTT